MIGGYVLNPEDQRENSTARSTAGGAPATNSAILPVGAGIRVKPQRSREAKYATVDGSHVASPHAVKRSSYNCLAN